MFCFGNNVNIEYNGPWLSAAVNMEEFLTAGMELPPGYILM